jgi:NADPH:quinone reductase-like Zn-dependent oxidoreductase
MRAVGLLNHGDPEVLRIVDVPEVHAVPGQVRIRVHAATVNPTDITVRNGARADQQKADPPPYEAATLPMNGLTARLSLDLLKLSAGQVIAVTGAAGAYGGYVMQLAKAEGLTVIADASEKDEKLVASLGADIVVRRGDDVASRFRGHFPQGVDGLADGAVLNERVIPAVRNGGAFTSVRGFLGTPQRDIRFTATFVRSYVKEWEKLDRLRQQAEAGVITLRVAEIYPPERAGDAHRRLEAGGTRGRLIVQF